MFKRLAVLFISCFLSVWAFACTAQDGYIDPTRPFSASASALGQEKKVKQLALQSIMRSSQQYKAIINNQVLRVGDSIGKYKLLAIHDNSVVLTSVDGQVTLKIFSGVVAKSK